MRKAAKAGKPRQLDLFGDFNGLPFQQQIDFYRHDANWSSRMVLGDSLLVMTSLAEKGGLTRSPTHPHTHTAFSPR